jgi:hypothetical protein
VRASIGRFDRNDRTVTLASSTGRPVTFEADGTIRAERGYPGGAANTRATLFGDQLVVTTTGTGGSDYQVTFEPMDNGRALQVTRRILQRLAASAGDGAEFLSTLVGRRSLGFLFER